jgi:hypothetical protein
MSPIRRRRPECRSARAVDANSMIEASLEKRRRKGLGRTLGQRPLVVMRPMNLCMSTTRRSWCLTDPLVVVVGLDLEEQSTPIALGEGRPEG